jgi:pimeloyl-ACP methyl ester carboxylesterase
MDERFAEVGDGITLCYEQRGPEDGEPLLLVMGLGTQLIGWPDGFVDLLAGRGFRVTRFDNRDIGRSTKLRDVPPPGPLDLLLRRREAAGYLLGDMARDAAGLLDALGLDDAHVAGASMGGMIAQTLAARHPEKVRSLTSIMSTTGGRFVGQPALAVLPMFLRPPASDPKLAVERIVQDAARVASPGFPRDEAELRAQIARAIERSAGGDQAGTGRQLMAILASGDRTAELRGITAPTVVLHGTADKLVQPSGARATAKAIPGAELRWVAGMGHDLPPGVWEQLADGICRAAERAVAAPA